MIVVAMMILIINRNYKKFKVREISRKKLRSVPTMAFSHPISNTHTHTLANLAIPLPSTHTHTHPYIYIYGISMAEWVVGNFVVLENFGSNPGETSRLLHNTLVNHSNKLIP